MYKNSCARTKCGCAAGPVDMENAVAAGMACETPCTDICIGGVDCGRPQLAQLIFPIQEYTYGFCPPEALAQGTLFPELASSCY